MLIYNGKGLLTGIAVVAVFLLLTFCKISMAYGFLVAGTVGMIVSIKLSNKGEGFFALPSVFFIPTHVYSVLIIIMGLVSFSDDSRLFEHKDKDLRVEMIKEDIAQLEKTEISGIDSVASSVKAYLVGSVIRQLKPDKISCLVKENKEENKVLLLIMFPKLKDLEDDGKEAFFKLVEQYIMIDEFFADKKVYTGILDKKLDLKYTKAPGMPYKSLLAIESDLNPFYSDSIIPNPN